MRLILYHNKMNPPMVAKSITEMESFTLQTIHTLICLSNIYFMLRLDALVDMVRIIIFFKCYI